MTRGARRRRGKSRKEAGEKTLDAIVMGVLLYYKGCRRGEGVSGSCRALLGKWVRQGGSLYVQVMISL